MKKKPLSILKKLALVFCANRHKKIHNTGRPPKMAAVAAAAAAAARRRRRQRGGGVGSAMTASAEAAWQQRGGIEQCGDGVCSAVLEEAARWQHWQSGGGSAAAV